MPQVQYRVAELTKTAADVPGKLAAAATDATPTNPSGPRAGVTTEFAALEAGGKVAATYLSDGRVGVRIPLVTPGDDPAATRFATWLTSDAGQAALAGAGLRTAQKTPDAAKLTAAGLGAAAATPVAAVPATALEGGGQLYQGMSQRMAILTVIDLSGSMAKQVAPNVRAIDLVTQATLALDWRKWAPGAVVGFMTFHTDGAQKPLIETPLPLTKNTAPEYPALAQGFLEATKTIQVGHGTPLNQAILQAYQYMESKQTPGYVSRVIILTDGKNEYAEPLMSEADLIAQLPKAAAGKPKLMLVALGPEADHAALARIAAATGHKSVWVQDIREYPQMVQKIMYGD